MKLKHQRTHKWQCIWHIFLIIISISALLYYLFLSLRYGIHYIVFSWVFLIIGLLAIAILVLERMLHRSLISYLPKPLRILAFIFLFGCIAIYSILQVRSIATGFHTSTTQANTVIVLGAQLNGSSISRLLRYRLDAAVSFHEQYPNATIIVSGGQGAKEDISEASAMKAYLVSKGINENQILCEDESRNTYENFAFSKKLIKNDTQVSVITNDFHMYRAAYLCEDSGLTCSLYPARSDLDLVPNFYLREFFGVIKDQYLTKLK